MTTNDDSQKNRIITQWLRSFTVSIHRLGDDHDDAELTPANMVGTGVAVSIEGQVVTCAHVIEAAGVDPRAADRAEVGVYYPQARPGERKSYRAAVAGFFPQHDDDVALLHLRDGPSPLAPEQIAVLGYAEDSFYHPFRSFGFRRLSNYIAGHAHGLIQGDVPAPGNLQLQLEPVQLESNQLSDGMSGAPVLDIERNLVVGIVSEVYFPDQFGKDANTAWGVNARVLSLEPLNLPLRRDPLPLDEAPQPADIYKEEAQKYTGVRPESQYHAAPPPLDEWVGRAELLAGLTRDYADPARRVTGLIGFGGEGKSSLARKWVDLLTDNRLPITDDHTTPQPPAGVFWWGFYDNPNADEFFEAALDFIGGGRIDPRRVRSSSAKAEVIAAMLANGRYVFVLDGLEVLQQQEGDDYGLFTSPDLQTFLELFAAPGHESFCLATSRAPLLDLMAYTSYIHRDVGPVSMEDGRTLLRELGVQGIDADLDRVVAKWDGHALTLSLLGTLLAAEHGGDVAYAEQIDPLAEAEMETDAARRRYSHVHRVLRRYDEHLTAAERAFMTLFSAFRTPVTGAAFARVFRPPAEAPPGGGREGSLAGAVADLTDAAFDELIARLKAYRLLRYNEAAATYTTHPLVRNHYLARLTESGRAEQTHEAAKAHYLALAGDTPRNPTLADLAPLIEVVYHACRAGAYDEAYQIHRERIRQENRYYDIHVLGAYETSLNIMLQFFPDGDTGREPQVSDPGDKSWILNTVGFCLMNLGRLATAVSFFERKTKMQLEYEDWRNASVGYRNLAHLNAYLGRLAASAAAAGEALALARRAENKEDECDSLAYGAWAAHLRGEMDAAGAAFREAEALEQEIDDSKAYLYSLRGVQHAEHLRRVGQGAYARRVTAANLTICERNRFTVRLSLCHSLMGTLEADEGDHAAARDHFDEALAIARSISDRAVLIEALLARGRWAARRAVDEQNLGGFRLEKAPPLRANLRGLLRQAFSDLREALTLATDGGYRVYEADIRAALAWARLAAGERDAARGEATRAITMSRGMGCYWGVADGEEVLAVIGEQ